MTDRSNYGPVRRLSPLSADNRKPYSRTGLKGVLGTLDLNSGDAAFPTASDSPYYPFHVETPQLEAPTQNRRPTAPDDGPRDIAGFPTYEQYLRIEDEYLSSLSERKQPKALISQALFDKIFAVLQNGSEDRASTAQFRFWVRKMFVLAYPQTSFFTSRHNSGNGGGQSQSLSSTEPIVLHDKRPVAIKEHLYEVLCYCHAVARHGGRDKTCATLRLHYSWVPKELTAKFVKACPTCTLKRSGNPDLLSQFGQAVQSHSQPSYAPPVTVTAMAEPALLFPGGPNDSPPSLSFVVGSAGCDEVGGGGCGSGAGFCPSIFATPDLSVYPSPTLSTGSLGPMTPSPFLSGGLFGYPAVFDPGHGGLSFMAGWDPSPLSPCVPMYAEEELCAGTPKHVQPVSADEITDMRVHGMQFHLPTPKAVRAMRARVHSCGGGSGSNGDGDRRCIDTFPGVVDTPCPVDMSNIDPVLLAEGGHPQLTLVGPPARTISDAMTGPAVAVDADADMNPCAGTGSGSGSDPYFQGHAATWETPTPVAGARYPMQGQTVTATPGRSLLLPPAPAPHATLATPTSPAGPPPMVMMAAPVSMPMHMPIPIPAVAVPRARRGILLCGGRGTNAEDDVAEVEEETVVDIDVEEDVEEDVDGDMDGDGDVDEDDPEAYRMRMSLGLPVPVEDARWDRPEAWLIQSDSMDDAASDTVV